MAEASRLYRSRHLAGILAILATAGGAASAVELSGPTLVTAGQRQLDEAVRALRRDVAAARDTLA